MLRRLFLTAVLALGVTAGAAQAEVAVFAGGCFWSTQKAFDQTPGVTNTRAGFMGGKVRNPGYQDVVRGGTGHAEAVEVTFDPKKVSYQTLLDTYWHSTDPTTANRVICDRGEQYRTVIFTFNDGQYQAATASKAAVTKQLGKPVVTQVVRASQTPLPFYPAEDYHQHYWRTHKAQYDGYYIGCGRGPALKKLWGDKAN
jgi:peptide-methionine (S)-S-oxide reductase